MKHKNRKKRSNQFLIILFVLAVIVVLAVLAVKYIDFDKIFNPTPEPKPTTAQVTPTTESTPTTEPTSESGTQQSSDPTPTPAPEPELASKVAQYDGNNPNSEDRITGAITYAGKNNDSLMIRVNIDQYLNGGECNLILESDGTAKYGAAANIVDAASTSTCEGFNVPLSELPAGKYDIVIVVTSERKSGTIKGSVNL
ncbi:hypothetical protein IKX64_00865 [Candidatus Saccharibacteria bacterium]|nr:hypothetical protein [Candidatus Saccharibacteria bacterium]